LNQLEIPLSNFLSDAKSGQIPTAPPNEDVSKYIRSILKNGLDRAFLDQTEDRDREPVRHGNIRGGGYYH
jgi:hypothetical protein